MNESSITLDLHGRNAVQARIALDAALRRAGGAVYGITVIHGSNRGDTLRALVRGEYAAHARVLRAEAVNDGCTRLVLREL